MIRLLSVTGMALITVGLARLSARADVYAITPAKDNDIELGIVEGTARTVPSRDGGNWLLTNLSRSALAEAFANRLLKQCSRTPANRSGPDGSSV